MYCTNNGLYLLEHSENHRPKTRRLRSEFDADTPLFPHSNYPDHTYKRRAICERIISKHKEPSLRNILKDQEIMTEIEKSGVDKRLVIRMMFDIELKK